MSDIYYKNTASLSPEKKRDLLAKLLQKKNNKQKFLLPLSYNQQSMWFLYKLAPQSWAYHVLRTCRIRSEVDSRVLQSIFQELVDRHSSLRTTYIEQSGRTFQQVHGHMQVHFENMDTSKWSKNDLRKYLVDETRHPFDLERDSVLRVKLFTQSTTEHILLLTGHQIGLDLWSLDLLLDELRVLYPAQKAGRQAVLPSVDLDYGSFVQWQGEMLTSTEGLKLSYYWQKELLGELPVLNIPIDRPRPVLQTYNGASHHFQLSEDLTRQLKNLAKKEEATLYITLLAIFHVLLYRYTEQEHILVGSPTTGRRTEFLAIVGNFINPIVLKADLSGSPTFKGFLSRERHLVLSAFEHKDYPFPLLIERLHQAHDPSRSPLFQVMFILRELTQFKERSEFRIMNQTELEINGEEELKIEVFDFIQQEGQLDLTLEITETDTQLSGVLKYNQDLFDAATIARMAGHFQTLLESVVANPEQPIATLPLLTKAEQEQLLVEWNNTKIDYPKDLCIHQLFEVQAERTPNSVAAVFDSKQITYQELNEQANHVAHYIRAQGVRPQGLVGIYIERSLEMLIGLLGILKAGGTYVPLDPAYPKERVAFMLEHAQVPMLLSQKHILEKLPEHRAKVVCLDSDWPSIVQESKENPISHVRSDNLAYIIYTSGSTGQPKGVQIQHRNVVNFLYSMLQRPGLTNQDTMCAVTSLSFDIAVLELFLPLIAGAKLVVISREVAIDGAKLLTKLIDSSVTIFQATPSTWRLLLTAGWQGTEQLKALCGGEALPQDLSAQILQRSNSLWNLYGPTETTIWSSIYQIESKGKQVLIGRPIANTQFYILDSYLQLVPVGIRGELYIGGAGLSIGYMNRPDLTVERFIHNPFSSEQPARLYKTGDQARYLPDGNIQYLNRLDKQVKLRGFRIELEEIEAVLSQHPEVQQAVVTVREFVPNDKRLVAYIVSNQQPIPTSDELRCFVQEKLPQFMVPSSFVILKALPLTPNGKIDLKSLGELQQTSAKQERAFVAPQNVVELQMLKVWERVLGVRSIDMKDNFFELGGNSLLAVQLLTQIKKVFQQEIPLATFFQAPIVEQLVKIIDQERPPASWSLIEVIPFKGYKQPLFWCGQSVREIAELTKHLGPSQPVYGLESWFSQTRVSNTEAQAWATYYLDEIRAVQPQEPYLLGGIGLGGWMAFNIAEQLQTQRQKVALLVLVKSSELDLMDGSTQLIDIPTSGTEQLLEQNYASQQAYLGRIALFFSSSSNLPSFLFPQGGKGKIFAGKIDYYLLAREQNNLVDKYSLQVLAEKLRSCLNEVDLDNY